MIGVFLILFVIKKWRGFSIPCDIRTGRKGKHFSSSGPG